jgi:SARP family transcriptional regulator, regulator of embCAB operon
MTAWRFLLLGPLEVKRDGVLLPLGGPKQRSVLALLLLESGRLVPAGQIIEHVWGIDGADGAQASLQVYVSNLRKLLRDPDPSVDTDDRLAFVRPGYRLRVAPGELDLHQVDEVLVQARQLRASGDLAAASHLLRFGLSQWRGRALADLADLPSFAPLLVGLDRRREVLQHECYDVELDLGRHLTLVPELEAAVAESPLDERLAGQHMIALYRSGRQADALAAYRRTSDLLADELGIDPGQPLRSLQESILRQDLALDPAVAGVDVAETMTHDDRGLRGATVTLPNGVALELGSRTWVVGRHPDCDIVLSDPLVSRRHAELRPVVGGYDLVDLGSSNGTRIGSDDVTKHRLTDGDEVEVGTTTLKVHLPA